MEFISQPWPWYVAGPLIALIMLSLLLSGKRFGLSSNLRSMCAIMGAGKHCEFFDFNWKAQSWNLVFVVGLMAGGLIASQWMDVDSVHISQETIAELKEMGVSNPGQSIVPSELFSWDNLLTIKGLIVVVSGGFLVGFGARYAGGCTSGHAISGLSDLQLPSLIAVIGFFIGGLAITYFVTPFLLNL
ncbi:MAG: YeeE/YedE thiosulfate transporter family protein [Pseudomonadales bacterium]|uniref:YeeE/YedE family protein n=1 Tax=Ekhidna sp. TaxID=2608089 RepID=UPI0032EC43C0